MKKTLKLLLMTAILTMALTACASGNASPNSSQTASVQTSAIVIPSTEASTPATDTVTSEVLQEPAYVTVKDFNRDEVSLPQNPSKVAIYDYSILDILYNIGFEKTGITQLIVPTKDSLPADLAYYKNQSDNSVITGGSLFYVDWDVLDLAQPEIVILGGRSFGMNAAGERLSSEDAAKYKSDTMERYQGASFIRLGTNSSNSHLTEDMENNAAALAAIFPEMADEIENKLDQIKSNMADINAKVKESGKTALFCMMVDQTTLSVFLPESRFDMLYEEFGFKSVDSEAVSWTDQHGFDARAEYVLEKNPDVIFLLDRSATVGFGAGAENFMNDPIIKKTTASQNENIYVLTGDAWYTMTGGFSAAEKMIDDINQFIGKLK